VSQLGRQTSFTADGSLFLIFISCCLPNLHCQSFLLLLNILHHQLNIPILSCFRLFVVQFYNVFGSRRRSPYHVFSVVSNISTAILHIWEFATDCRDPKHFLWEVSRGVYCYYHQYKNL
jgi:hypothetical protein